MANPKPLDERLLYLVHHVFLPPELPHHGDSCDLGNESHLLKTVYDALERFRKHYDDDTRRTIDRAYDAIRNMKLMKDGLGNVNEDCLSDMFDQFLEGDLLAIHVQSQNAGVLASYEDDKIRFDFVELSPPNNKVMGTVGRLRRCFPSSSVLVPEAVFVESGCRAMLSFTLARMSAQEVAEAKPKIRKAGDTQVEDRDTKDPCIITDLFYGVVAAMGTDVPHGEPNVWKNTREEVKWHDANRPWRRSALWLFVRVTLHVFFSRGKNKSLYKEFMIFYMSELLDSAMTTSLSRDLLYCMAMKTSRRIHKLGLDNSCPWLVDVRQILDGLHGSLGDAWKEVQRGEHVPEVVELQNLNFDQAIYAGYPELRSFVNKVTSISGLPKAFQFSPPWTANTPDPSSVPNDTDFQITSANDAAESSFRLCEIEDWVARHLDGVLNSPLNGPEICEALGNVMTKYHRLAETHYSRNPDSYSIMILTILELWVACDKAACKDIPLLSKYSPEIPNDLLESLCLPLRSQMERLSRVENYLAARRVTEMPSIFSSFGEQNSFSVKYFATSPWHKQLLQNIEQRANDTRMAKIQEYRTMRAHHASLLAWCDRNHCNYETVYDHHTRRMQNVHSSNCQKCQIWNQCNTMLIEVHEWPLPEDPLKCQAIAFELDVPPSFRSWRDTTLYLLTNVLGCHYPEPEPDWVRHKLAEYFPHDCKHTESRILLASTQKSNTVTHRASKLVGKSSEADVLVKHGPTWAYYDSHAGKWCRDRVVGDKVPYHCTHQLEEFSGLQKYLVRPSIRRGGPSPNDVITQETDCNASISLQELRATAGLPVGYRIQWANILANLHSPIADFNREDTLFILFQTIYQTGPPASGKSVYREAHWQLSKPSFIGKCIEGLNARFDAISENWEHSFMLEGLVVIATRLLSFAPSAGTISMCLDFLAKCRATAFKWTERVQAKAKAEKNSENSIVLFKWCYHVALVCARTFDVDDEHLEALIADSGEATTLISCSMIIQCLVSNASSDVHLLNLTQDWRRVLHRTYKALREQIVRNNSECLNAAIKRYWPNYHKGTPWKPIPVETTQKPKGDEWLTSWSNQVLHFNVATAELLIGGKPLSFLPADYCETIEYKILFGNTRVEVVSSRKAGMEYTSTAPYEGAVLHFRKTQFHDMSRLVVMTEVNQVTFYLVPPHAVRGLPAHFVDDYTHWYNPNTRTVEFRPKNAPWTSSPRLWNLTPGEGGWALKRDSQYIVPLRNKPAISIYSLIRPLEVDSHVHFILDTVTKVLDIELPRLRIGFSFALNTYKIHSKQFGGMYIETNQSVGTLIGLQNKLVLGDIHGSRKLILLEADSLDCEPTADHVLVTVRHETVCKVHAYDIDSLLGTLRDKGSLQSKLLLGYMHALTSYCLPDPLTGKTGTERALEILNSAAVHSFGCLTKENISMLQRIAHISPGRKFYPKDIQDMEVVEWASELSFMAQSGKYLDTVLKIFDTANEAGFLYSEEYISPAAPLHSLDHLRRRSSIREAVFQVSEFGAESHTTEFDKVYHNRSHTTRRPEFERAFQTAVQVFEQRRTLYKAIRWNLAIKVWEFLSIAESIPGINENAENTPLLYDAKWLDQTDENLRTFWCRLLYAITNSSPTPTRFSKTMFLATLAYSRGACYEAIEMLALFSMPGSNPYVHTDDEKFPLKFGFTVSNIELRRVLEKHRLPLAECPEGRFLISRGETPAGFNSRKFASHARNMANAISKALVWFCRQPSDGVPASPPDSNIANYINMDNAILEIQAIWRAWAKNRKLWDFISQLTRGLKDCPINPISALEQDQPHPPIRDGGHKPYITLLDLFEAVQPPVLDLEPFSLDLCCQTLGSGTHGSTMQMDGLVRCLEEQARRDHERNYVKDLQASLDSLKQQDLSGVGLPMDGSKLQETLNRHLDLCHQGAEALCHRLLGALRRLGRGDYNAFLWPRISQSVLVAQLSRRKWHSLPEAWRKAVTNHGIAVARVQHARKMVSLLKHEKELVKELSNPGHANWDPSQHPEWLLLEIESEIRIREVQVEVAEQMSQPPGSQNAVLQLNMGEGKSTVIVPIVASHLADGTRLVRVIVAKPQAKESFRTLVSKLAGMVDRRILRVPFARSLRLTQENVVVIWNMFRTCLQEGGILLMQPEELLSIKLAGIERLLSNRPEIGKPLLRMQQFLNTNCRDLIDESDENFAVKFELIYTLGSPTPIELSPDRWIIIQQMLKIMADMTLHLQNAAGESIDIVQGNNHGFPRLRFPEQEATSMLLSEVAREVCKVGLPGFPIARMSTPARDAVLSYISERCLNQKQIQAVENDSELFSESTKGLLYLLRGLLAHGILEFCLTQKRWRVNYGLDHNRNPATRLTVPYRAKDVPSLRSEFSHLDVVITLTCLAYYYSGLSDDDLIDVFEHLTNSNDGKVTYGQWIQRIPVLLTSFRHLSHINTHDIHNMKTAVFPHLRFAKPTIDYFLSKFVFPKEMRQFPEKLSASGWDIGEEKALPVTGFSGTNDSRLLLPLDVHQLDLPKQRHTNALVLNNILRPENTVVCFDRTSGSQGTNAELFLKLVTSMEPPPEVILDVGAQVLELTNTVVAQSWLQATPKDQGKEAVVYFNDQHELCVLDRTGNEESLPDSPYCEKLDQCLVYLDEAHTRGTDLKMPNTYRAVVTLGPGLTKDSLAQACMRMRQLGKGQSLTFCVSQEIQRSIRSVTGVAADTPVRVMEVLCWSIQNTYTDLRSSMPLWALQGRRHIKHQALWHNLTTDSTVAKRFLEQEAQSLERRYRPTQRDETPNLTTEECDPRTRLIMDRLDEFGIPAISDSISLSEEHEREVATEIQVEVQQERQLTRPPPPTPAQHHLHNDVEHFVKTGILRQPSSAFLAAFETLRGTSVGRHLEFLGVPGGVKATADFAQTIEPSGHNDNVDGFVRPVQYVLTMLSAGVVQHVVIISPFEAQELIPLLRGSAGPVSLHIYASNGGAPGSACGDLGLFLVPSREGSWGVPRLLRLELDLFAGQLYFKNLVDYQETCGMLGIRGSEIREEVRKFLKGFLSRIRGGGRDIRGTHWGRILDGEVLGAADLGN